jgi:hypothetical protein
MKQNVKGRNEKQNSIKKMIQNKTNDNQKNNYQI